VLTRVLFAVACLACFSPVVLAETLTTPSYVITIRENCGEGNVACDDVSCLAVSRKTGKSITLRGRTLHTACRDNSPCRFLGYEFASGRTIYRVTEDGTLEVRRGGKMLVHEKGAWH